MGGPPSKPKYSYVTDSEQVPWGKGEKYPDKGNEIVPETKCLQAVGAYELYRIYILYIFLATLHEHIENSIFLCSSRSVFIWKRSV